MRPRQTFTLRNMLRDRDLLLTVAAFFLLMASLDVKPRVIRASAQQQQQLSNNGQMVPSATNTGSETIAAKMTEADIDLMMQKIKRNLGTNNNNQQQQQQQQQQTRNNQTADRANKQSQPQNMETDQNHNLYTHYANETMHSSIDKQFHQQAKQMSDSSAKRFGNDGAAGEQHKRAQEVKVEFLRSPEKVAPAGTGATREQQNHSLYMLNYAPVSSLSDDILSNEIDTSLMGAEQQQPPFTMMPPFNQQQQLNNPQLQRQNALTQENIRQILNNYQRYPQAQQFLQQHGQRLLANHQRQQQQQQQQNIANGQQVNQAAQPPVGVQQPQQPFSPLQLLTGPLQALLPGLNQQQPASQLQQNNKPAVSAQAKQPARAKNQNKAQQNTPADNQLAGQQQQQPFNPFAPSVGGAAPGGNTAGQQQLPPLQALYQQLPLYQALLAARQRQEALDAAQKLRQQQQLGQNNNGAGASATPARPPGLPFNLLQPFGVQPQQQQPVQPQLPAVNNFQQPQQNFEGQQPPANGFNQNQHTQAPALQNPNTNAVQFDDDNNQGGNQQQQPANDNNNQLQQQQQPKQQGGEQDDNRQQDANNENNESNNENNSEEPAGGDQNNNQGDQGSDNGGNGDSGNNNGNQSGGSEGGKSEEDDPDLKQFQNLANGGDSFTDLFPPGILSNNDISDIKKQQEEQAKKQEEEERQKQMQHQQQQQQQQQQQPFQPQQQFDQQQQPINQFANNNNNFNGNNLQQQQQPVLQQQQQQQQQDPNANTDGNGNNEEQGGGGENDNGANNDAPEQPENDDAGQDGGGGGGGTDGEGGGEGGNEDGGEAESPTAAALTAKSEGAIGTSSKQQQATAPRNGRFTESPGVVYS